jgi:hypothetical protein
MLWSFWQITINTLARTSITPSGAEDLQRFKPQLSPAGFDDKKSRLCLNLAKINLLLLKNCSFV